MEIKDELATLTLKNVTTVSHAYNLMKKLDTDFINWVGQNLTKLTLKAFPDWMYWNGFSSNGAFHFHPSSWYFTNPNDQYAYFALSLLNKKSVFWISNLTAQEGVEPVIDFIIDPGIFGDKASQRTGLRERFFFENEQNLKKAGFVYGGNGRIFHPFTLNLDLIVDSYPAWDINILDPVRNVLTDINSVLNIFNNFVKGVSGMDLPELKCPISQETRN